ncbi:NAD(P)-binding domain-containing protein [Neorhizobium sp. JUb45]|uniref:NADPH-dependent F420 reductase n=1 Tax=Neorhizobium sp. JUb45 TaxID=2485113 RepID=UPI0010469644|nr:NAD(P)-binding domain-containing protein [Neorhizobium sp. JUb45]TCQ99424.1 hypothetical protein EDF70_109130 [Neorhizobium sp. JUb45]
MTNITILGAGRVAKAIATRLAASGRPFTIGVRDVDRSAQNWTGPSTIFKTSSEAIQESDVIFNATPGETSVEFLKPLSGLLAGRILVDVSNALKRDDKGMPIGLAYPDSSVGEKLQEALPDTSVVKTLNTMLFSVICNPNALSVMPVAFLSGNNDEAKHIIRGLLQGFGWRGELIEDLGGIRSARGPESFMNFVPAIIAKHGFDPFALTIAR